MKLRRVVVGGLGLVVLFGAAVLMTYAIASQLTAKETADVVSRANQGVDPSTTINSATQSTPTTILGITTQISHEEFAIKLLNLINAYRKENKTPPLRVQLLLNRSANLKLDDMIANHYWRHEDPNNVMSWYFFDQVGYPYESAGENLAFGAISPWQVFTDWQNSPTHNEQLLNEKYDEMGIAVDCETYASQSPDGGCIVVLHLGKQKL